MISIKHISCYYGNSVIMATRAEPVNEQHPGLLSGCRSCVPNTTPEELQMAKLQARASVSMVRTFQY